MANNYTHFSTKVAVSPEVEQWAWDYFESMEHYEDLGKMDMPEEFTGFQMEAKEGGVTVYDEAGEGMINTAVDFIQRLLQKEREVSGSVEPVLFEWAYTCSSHRPGEFGGSKCLIFHNCVTYPPTTGEWVRGAIEDWEMNQD